MKALTYITSVLASLLLIAGGTYLVVTGTFFTVIFGCLLALSGLNVFPMYSKVNEESK